MPFVLLIEHQKFIESIEHRVIIDNEIQSSNLSFAIALSLNIIKTEVVFRNAHMHSQREIILN